MNTRWLNPEEILATVNPTMTQHGWAQLPLDGARVLGAFDEKGDMLEFFVVQLYPFLGPMLRVDNEARDGGETSRELATKMYDYLIAEQARGFIAVAQSPVTERLCQRFKMEKVEAPVYVYVRPEEGS